MQVLILKTEQRLGVKAGEVYEASTYRYDPEKVSLDGRVPDGYDPGCNQYKSSIGVKIRGSWHKVVDNCYEKISDKELKSLGVCS